VPDPRTLNGLLPPSIGESSWYQVIDNPRGRWPRETDLTHWLAGHLDQLASCLSVQRLQRLGREVVIGERWITTSYRGHMQTVGGMRLDLAARDEHDRLVIIEAQIGPADHEHLGKLITYAHTVKADLAVWVLADTDPLFYAEHLATLAELNNGFAGRRAFSVVAVTVESVPSLIPLTPDTPRNPRLRRVDLLTQRLIN
jgi:hypothetical protein